MKTMTKTILGGLLLLSTPLAAPASDTALIPVTLLNKRDVDFGYGYDTKKQALRGFCVDNMSDEGKAPATDVGQVEGDFVLRFQKSESQVADKLSISGEGRYQSGVYKASASADFYNEASKSDFKASYTYAAELMRRERMTVNRQFPLRATHGFLPYLQKSMKDGIKWYEKCGDEYVNAKIEAARLFVNVSVSFVSQSEMKKFQAKFGLETPVLDLKTQAEQFHKEFSSANVMTVQAYQVGGDPSRLGLIVCPKNVDGKVDEGCEKGSRAVINCGFGKIEDCTSMIANAIAYSNSLDKDYFPSQVEGGKNMVVTSLETASYQDTGGADFPPQAKQPDLDVLEAARNRVMGIFELLHKNWIYAQSLAAGQAPRLSVKERSAMEEVQNDIFHRMELSAQAVDVCYDGTATECKNAYPALAKNTGYDKDPSLDKTLHAKIFALTAPQDFVQYCDMSDSDHPGYQRTVETLRGVARTALGQNAGTLETGDRCLTLAIWLEGQKSLEIPAAENALNPTIGDLGPIAALKNLEVLSIKGQGLRDVSPLKALMNLKELTLDDNLIEDVSPLKELSSLERLNIQNNRVASVDALRGLDAHLRVLDARGNRDGLSCPLSSPVKCRIMSFADYADISSAYTKCDEILHPAAVALDDTHILATGGRAATDRSARMQVVDNQGCRTLPKPLAVPRIGHTMTMTPNGILIIGGGTNKIERVDLRTLEPTVLPATLAENATNHTATLLPDGRVLVVGGASDADGFAAVTHPQSLSGLVQVVGTDGKVETLGRLAVPRAEHSATLLGDGTVLIVGGYSVNDMIDIVERIDPVRKTVTTLPVTLPFGRSGHAAALLSKDHVLIAGGQRWGMVPATSKVGEPNKVRALVAIDQVLDLDAATGKWRELDEKLNPAIAKPQLVATIDNRVLIFGGLLDSKRMLDGTPVTGASSQIQLYDPTTEAFYKVKDMLNRRIGFTATPVGQNSVLIFGGAPSWSYANENGKEKLTQDPFTTATELLVYRPR